MHLLSKGKNSYVTLHEADKYIASRYAGNGPERQDWDPLIDRVREQLLLRSCDAIEQLRFAGRKHSRDQTLEFPRGRSNVVPAGVCHAQVEYALWLAQKTSEGHSDEDTRAKLIAQGVTSYSIGDLSESYDSGKVQRGATACPAAAQLLQPFLGGVFPIC